MEIFDSFWGMIKNHFFCDFRTTVATIFLIIGAFCIYLLLKDNYEKLSRTLLNIVGAVVNCALAFALF